MDYQDIRYTSEEHSAIITIDRPERMNAFRGRTVDELIRAFKRAWADPAVACVIFTGAGDRAFCAGGDQKEYAQTGSYGTSENGLWEIEDLHQSVDQDAGKLARRHAGRLQCARGCALCCVDGLTVFQEAHDRCRRVHDHFSLLGSLLTGAGGSEEHGEKRCSVGGV